MSFAESFARWIIRIWCGLLGLVCIQVLVFNVDSWEKQFSVGVLDAQGEAIARTGVYFDHGFQSALWMMCILVSEFGDIKMRQIVLGITAYAMIINGTVGLKYFYVGCDEYNLCLVGAMNWRIICGLVSLLCIIAISLNHNNTRRGEYNEVV